MALLLLARGAVGDDRGRPDPLTAFEAGPWARSSLVVLAEVREVRPLGPDAARGVVAGRARPERAFKGSAPEGEITFLVGGPRPTLDRDRPSAPYLSPGTTGPLVLFLARRGDGEAWSLVGTIEVEGAVGEERLRSIEAEAALLSIPDIEERARRTVEHFASALRQGGVWTRVHAARELNHLAERRPDLFDAEVRSRITTAYRVPGTPAQRQWLRRLLLALGAPPPADDAPAPPEDPDAPARLADLLAEAGPDPAARRAALQAFLERGGSSVVPFLLQAFRREEPLLRAWVADALAEGGYRSSLPHLRVAYAHEEEPDVRAAIVRATGFLGSDEDVPWLEERLGNPRLEIEALLALARLRTPLALAVVRAQGERAAGRPPEEEQGVCRLVDYLLSDGFPEAEREAGRSVGPREGDGTGGR